MLHEELKDYAPASSVVASRNVDGLLTVISTGFTRGIGLATAERMMQEYPDLHIINFGRSTSEQVRAGLGVHGKALQFPNVYSGERMHCIDGVDLSKPGTFAQTIAYTLRNIKGKIDLVGVAYCAGEAQLGDCREGIDATDSAKIESMLRVNGESPVVFAESLMRLGLLNTDTPFMSFSSLAAYHDRARVPQLGMYCVAKDTALNGLNQVLGSKKVPLTKVYPSVYLTGMVFPGVDSRAQQGLADGFITDVRAPLEFFGIAPAQAVPTDGLMRAVSREMGKGKNAAREIARPIIPAWYVREFNTDNGRRMALPIFVKLFGRQVLEAIGQGEEEHNARIDWHRQHESYGTEGKFPYEKFTYDKLANPAISRALTALGRPFDLV